ncbi:MAG: hypothetical protein NTV88_03290 [Candidatus Micrarchaeota archaeon]|nr:hypothetical protein [Candidatus Micrarchaeota archaeon]
MNSKRGQVSTELLIIIGMMLLLLVPLLYYSYSRANVVKEDAGIQKAEFAVQRMARLADSIGYMGGASEILDEIQLPQYVKSISVDEKTGHDIIIEMDSTTGIKQIVKSSAFKIKAVGFDNRKLQEGSYWVDIKAISDPANPDYQILMTLQ